MVKETYISGYPSASSEASRSRNLFFFASSWPSMKLKDKHRIKQINKHDLIAEDLIYDFALKKKVQIITTEKFKTLARVLSDLCDVRDSFRTFFCFVMSAFRYWDIGNGGRILLEITILG